MVTAPFDGRIDRRLVDPGNLVGSTESTVLTESTRSTPFMSISPSMKRTCSA